MLAVGTNEVLVKKMNRPLRWELNWVSSKLPKYYIL